MGGVLMKPLIFEFDSSLTIPTGGSVEDRVYRIKELQKYKLLLNNVRQMIDDKDMKQWRYISFNTNIGLGIKKYVENKYHINKVSRAFLKMYELLNILQIAKKYNVIKSLHICEAPGKFIHAFNYYLAKNEKLKGWMWCANSLNPFNEGNIIQYPSLFGDDYGYMKKHPDRWLWGKDETGDITNPENILDISEKAISINIVTSDGGLSVPDFNEQEGFLSHIILSQVVTGLLALDKGGSSIFKMFLPLVESITISTIYLLYSCFYKISIVKQMSSSPGSGEVYVVCENYKYPISDEMKIYLLDMIKNYNSEVAIFPKNDLSDTFLNQYDKMVGPFINNQINTIKKNLYYYENFSQFKKDKKRMAKYKITYASKWADAYMLHK